MNLKISLSYKPPKQLYWVKHDIERGPLWRFGLPEVFRLNPDHSVRLEREEQLFIKALNPLMTPEKWRVLLSHDRAFTNKSAGYDDGGEPKQDWVNMRNTDAIDVPRFDTIRICGGALITGIEFGTDLLIESINADNPLPSVNELPIYLKFCALNVTENGWSRFPQGDGNDVWIPLLSRFQLKYPLEYLIKIDINKPLPNPYNIYKQ